MINTLIKISHRGNTFGPSKKENHPDYIIETSKAFHVEIDVWWHKSNFWLGHDAPVYKIEKKFLENKKLWCHVKNIECLSRVKDSKIHYFFHNDDDATLTSLGFIWCYPGKEVEKSIVNQPEWFQRVKNLDLSPYAGVCSDYIGLI